MIEFEALKVGVSESRSEPMAVPGISNKSPDLHSNPREREDSVFPVLPPALNLIKINELGREIRNEGPNSVHERRH